MILKLGVDHQGMDLYKVYINHDPGMALTYFVARSILGTFYMGKNENNEFVGNCCSLRPES